jgi:hypothetical protein
MFGTVCSWLVIYFGKGGLQKRSGWDEGIYADLDVCKVDEEDAEISRRWRAIAL